MTTFRQFQIAAAPAVISLVTLGVAGAAAAPASAAQYTVNYCNSTPGYPAPFADYMFERGKSGIQAGGTASCEQDGTMGLIYDARDFRIADSGTWALTASGGLTIVNHAAGGTYKLSPGTTVTSSALGSAVCGPDTGPCQFGKWSGTAQQPAGTTRAYFTLTCTPTSDPATCTPSRFDIQSDEVTFNDPAAPTGAIVGGDLTEGGLTTPVSGTASVTARADDSGSGVRRLEAVVDGVAAGATQDQCAPPYGVMHPCTASLTGTVAVDTTKIANGTRQLQVVAEDAAGQRSVIGESTIVVNNGGAVGPGSDPNLRGAANGNYGADDAKITAWWPATGRTASKKKSVQRRCKASKSYRRAHKLQCDGRAPSRRLSADFSTKKKNLVRGVLTSAGGQPIAGATVELVQTPAATGLPTSVTATATTDATGRFVGQVPAASGSATIAVNWRARARDTMPAASSLPLRRKIRAATTFGVSPKRSVRRGRTLSFRGTLRGKAGTPKGTAITVQAYSGGTWRTVKASRAATNGRWAVRYRVQPQLRGTYRFRALVTPSGAYPYNAYASTSRSVRVR